jgi:cyclophilin family peptidyl-prolyl cis-trans isomerase
MRSLLSLFCFAIAAATAQTPSSMNPDEVEAVVTTDLGSFRFEFANDKAPKHVAQFISLAQKNYYDGSAFFRVIQNGIVQGGDPLLKNPNTPRNLWGTGGLNLLPSEINDLKHERGTVSTVRLPNKLDSDGAQFFICVTPQPALDGKYTAFGRVTEGIDVIERISQVPADSAGLAQKPIRILKITIEPKKKEPFANASPDELRRTVTMKTTLGVIRIQTQPEWAPNNVRRFLMLTATGWYNGTAFHRLAKGFVVQGGMGDTRAGGLTHPADRWIKPVKGEFRDDVKHTRGIVSMARGDDPDSATTSFFFVLAPSPHLDGKYSAIGRVIEGLNVLDAFEKEETDGEKPRRRLEIVEATVDAPATP